MPVTDWINPVGKLIDLGSELIEDKDKRNEFIAQGRAAENALKMAQEKSHQIALQQKTIPFMDALYKMGRQLQGYVGQALCAYMIYSGVTDPLALAACFGPSALYAVFKDKGKKSSIG